MNAKLTQLEKQRRRIGRRLNAARRHQDDRRPVLGRTGSTAAMPHGGLGAVLEMVRRTGLVGRINADLRVLAVHKPYHESDHVLCTAFKTA